MGNLQNVKLVENKSGYEEFLDVWTTGTIPSNNTNLTWTTAQFDTREYEEIWFFIKNLSGQTCDVSLEAQLDISEPAGAQYEVYSPNGNANGQPSLSMVNGAQYCWGSFKAVGYHALQLSFTTAPTSGSIDVSWAGKKI